MDVFKLRQHIVDEYASYTQSFLQIRDPRINDYVQRELQSGKLWPDALVQLSPSYEPADDIDTLVAAHILHEDCARIFRSERDGTKQPFKLYRHQRRAIDFAQQRKHFVVTTGTGSGKSLTYMLPIIDHVLKHKPEQGRVRAIIVYPMNALINSQDQALKRFFSNYGPNPPVRFARYTGQESEAAKREIQQNPPHILLTNYVMLELMLTRPEENAFVDKSTALLDFVVLDELHTYRGRQGADVALLMRRLRERSGNPNLLCIGTSATMASGEEGQDTRVAVASVASTIFGVNIAPDQVIEETLIQATSAFNQPTDDELRKAVLAPPTSLTWDEFRVHPLAQWIESTFSLNNKAGVLTRARPRDLRSGAEALAQRTGVDVERCAEVLRNFFQLGSQIITPEGKPAFTFKLHQFISQGGAVYATLKQAPQRSITLEAQYTLDVNGEQQVLYPLIFCRECGQHYYLCTYDTEHQNLLPRLQLEFDKESKPLVDGYLLIDSEVWNAEMNAEALPESWYDYKRRNVTIKQSFRDHVPQQLFCRADGSVDAQPSADTTEAWFMPAPFLTCLHCGVVYTRREREFGKLAGLSSEGRSTATTLISVAAIDDMRKSDLDDTAKKLLSFTDNRQDASLQAGHFNDFVSVALLRAAIYKAVEETSEPLNYISVAKAVFKSLNLTQEAYAKTPSTMPGPKRRNEEALTALLEYRIYEDLRRGWRITQPNLEQCGLLKIDYLDLKELCEADEYWQQHKLFASATPERRELIVRTVLDYMRRELAIDAPCLQPNRQQDITRQVNAYLNEQWRFDDDERLRTATIFYEPSDEELPSHGRSLSARGTLGRFLRSALAWPELSERSNSSAIVISEDEYPALLNTLLTLLQDANLIINVSEGKTAGYQLRHNALLWLLGDGTMQLDLLRTRYRPGVEPKGRPINQFFREFYTDAARNLRNLEGREHTGQVLQDDREEREQRFRNGELQVMFCSPTMELGIDIADLNMVHMRNVPPTPANYAQRSGRAGRSGQAAMVVTYCSTSSGHDQYFFQRPAAMVAGVVAAPQIDLANEDLLRAHIHAIWMRFTDLPTLKSMLDLIDIEQPGYPLRADVQQSILLDQQQAADCRATCLAVLDACRNALQTVTWYNEGWLDRCLNEAPKAFDEACDRWRKLYDAAKTEIDATRHAIDTLAADPRAKRKEREELERREQEAKHQRALLSNNPLNKEKQGDGDFYPYRYLASEGFLPGYNFPRLPVRAFLRTDSNGQNSGVYLNRPRFLAISEFGPQNIIYHEGRKYRVSKGVLSSGDARLLKHELKACSVCGYLAEAGHERCTYCGVHLTHETAQYWSNLIEMPMMGTRRIERITSQEEERLREGYRITTHFRFSSGPQGVRRVEALLPDDHGDPMLQLTYGPAASIWRINHGWRRLRNEGFALHVGTGEWGRSPNSDSNGEEPEGTYENVRLMVQDTRNLLLLHAPDLPAKSAELVSLQYAIQRAIVEEFQLENQELASERIEDRVLYWEAAEGGAGVLRRLVEEPQAMARVARRALEICHFDPDTGAEHNPGECAHACYRCLLSYSNQPDHAQINRHTIRDLLMEMQRPTTLVEVQSSSSASATEHSSASAPSEAHAVVEQIAEQHNLQPEQVHEQDGWIDLRYNRRWCVLVPRDGADAAALNGYAEDLSDQGYVVYTLSLNRDLAEQVAELRFA